MERWDDIKTYIQTQLPVFLNLQNPENKERIGPYKDKYKKEQAMFIRLKKVRENFWQKSET